MFPTESDHSPIVGAMRLLFCSWDLHRLDKLLIGSTDHVVEVPLEEADCVAVELHTDVSGRSLWRKVD